MNASLVLTIIGPDRPGLVESVSASVAAHGGNWLESRLARLAGKFAGMLHVEVPAANVEALTEALRGLESQGLTVVVAPADEAAPAAAPRLFQLELIGQDRPGIVRDISHAIAARGVNVDELETECTPAPMSGETLFKATATLRIPPDAPLDQLHADLERIAADLMVDITLKDEDA